MQTARLKSIDTGTGTDSEYVLMAGYNATGAAIVSGQPVCWDVVASDGRTLKTPTATGFVNYRTFAGIVTEAVVSAGYTHRIQVYGVCTARTYGVASTFIPGCSLILIADQTYVAYGTEGQLAGQVHSALVALQTNATTSTVSTKVFVRAM